MTVLSIRPPRRTSPRPADRTTRGGRTARPAAGGPGLAGRSPVASFARYADAQRALNRLAAARFPVHRTALVGGQVKLVEEAAGRLNAARCAVFGGAGGAWLGAFMGLYAVVAQRSEGAGTVRLLAWGLLLGAGFGAALGAVAHFAVGRGPAGAARRHLTGARYDLVAGRYELYADDEVAAPALRVLMRLRPAGLTPVDAVPVEVLPATADPLTAA